MGLPSAEEAGTGARRVEIAVVGGGHGSYAAAADLAERGHGIRLWRRDAVALEPLREAGALTLTDSGGVREVALDLVSTDLGAVLDGAELVLVPLPATAQADVAARLAPHLSDGQVVFAPPGSFGAFLMAQAVEKVRPGLRVAWAEAGTLPYLARKHGPTAVTITGRATRLPTGVFPAEETDRAFAVLRAAFPAVEPLTDALDAALTNAGPIIHPPLIVLNAAPIEHFETWDIHGDGLQPGVRRVQDRLDSERIAIRSALGYGSPHYPLRDHYEAGGEEWMYGDAAQERVVGAGDWNEPLDLVQHRYVREDILLGLGLLISVGAFAEVETPLAAGLRAVAATFAGDDLRAPAARTLAGLGLAELAPEQLRELLRKGFV